MHKPPSTASISRPTYTLLCIIFFALSLFSTNATQAQGFGVFEQSACAQGRAETGVAMTCEDGSAIFYNPAGLAGTRGFTASLGATLVIANGSFFDDRMDIETDLDNAPLAVPHLFVSYGLSEKLAAGLGVYVPYGLGTTWPETFDGSFLGYDNSIKTIYLQPTAAYQVTDQLSVGAGLIVAVGSVEITQRLDLSAQPVPGQSFTFANLGIPFHTAFADAVLEGSNAAGAVGGNLGFQFQATDWLRVGARYMTPIKLDYTGTATFEQVETGILLPAGNPLGAPAGTPLDVVLASQFEQGGALADQRITTEITMPPQFVAGLSVRALPELMLLFDYQWTGWSSFDEIPLSFDNALLDQVQVENYEDTNGFRFGAEYALNQQWTLRGGYLFSQAAAPDETVTPLLPEADRNHLTLGLGWQAASLLEINVGYQYINQEDRRGRTREIEAGDTGVEINNGLYTFNSHLLGGTITLKF